MKKFFAILLVISLLMATSSISFASRSADESLDKLSVSKSKSTSSKKTYDLFPKFDPEILEYNVFLPDDMDYAYIYMKPDKRSYKVYCDGNRIDDDDYYAYIDDIDDEKDIDIVVRDDDDDKLDTYTINFFRGDDDDDDEDELESLSVKEKEDRNSYSKVSLNKDFDEDEDEYTVSVKENDYDTVRIYAEAKDSGAHVLINGELLDDDDYLDVKVKKGKNEFDIYVIAENCDESEKYQLIVNYDSKDSEDEKKAEAIISSLSVKDNNGNTMPISPTFNSGKKNYTANVGANVQSVNFYMMAGINSKIYLNNATLNTSTWSQSYNLKEGVNTFNITVYLTGDSYDIKNYSVSIYKHPKKIASLVSAQNLNVNGISKRLNAYNISGSNFVKLRDIASLLSGSNKQFSVGYNELTNAIGLLSGGYYSANGQENLPLKASKDIMISIQTVTLDNRPITMTAYNIDGNNYVMLRDLAVMLNFGLSYNSATDTIQITTNTNYSTN